MYINIPNFGSIIIIIHHVVLLISSDVTRLDSDKSVGHSLGLLAVGIYELIGKDIKF